VVSPDPSLVVRMPGEVFVATDELLAHLPLLAELADDLEHDAHRLGLLSLDYPLGPLRKALDECERRTFDAADTVRRLRAGIITAELGYAQAERTAIALVDVASNWATAVFAPWLGPLALPPLVVGGAMVASDQDRRAAVTSWILDHPEAITSPEFSALVRRVVTGADDAILGRIVPPWVLMLLGDHGLGLLGVGTTAAVVTGVSARLGARVLNETPVSVERVGSTVGTAPPAGAAERLARVPEEKQVRIERYSAPGEEDRFIVYVAPTQSFSPVAGEEPWDLTSNIVGVGGLSSGSIRATEQAMAEAGIGPESPVVLVGYSQGGIVTDAITGSGRWNVKGLETYGDPGGTIALPDGVRGVAVRHSDDFVVATGGPQPPVDRVIVERRAFPEGSAIPTDKPVPAHQKDAYAETARRIDDAASPAIRGELAYLDAFARDYSGREAAEVTTFEYRAERVSGSSSGVGR